MTIKYFSLIFILLGWCHSMATLAVETPPSQTRQSLEEVRKKLIKVAKVIQNYETELSEVEEIITRLQEEEKKRVDTLGQKKNQLSSVLHYLRHLDQYSPVLGILSATSVQDLAHSVLLLRTILPQIQGKNLQLIQDIRELVYVREQLSPYQKIFGRKMNRLKSKQRYLEKLLKEKEDIEIIPTDTTLKKTHQLTEKAQETGGIVNILNTHYTVRSPRALEQKLALRAPVVGRVIPCFGQTTGEYSSFSKGILFLSRLGAQVVAPIQGKVVFSGSFHHYGNMVILQQNGYYLALSGLHSLNSQIGQTFLKGEPIGRMPTKGIPKLYLELWHEIELIDPSPWFTPHDH